jgi:beta-lactamase regulating signal transducer with metallopeptidase domain
MIAQLFLWAERLQGGDVWMLLIEITLLAAVGRLLLVVLPRASAALRSAIAVTTLAAMLAVPLVKATRVTWTVSLPRSSSAAATTIAPPVVSPIPSVRPFVTAVEKQLPPRTQRGLAALEHVQSTWRGWLWLFVAIVAAGALAHLAIGVFAVTAVARSAEPIDDPELLAALASASGLLGHDENIRALASDRVPTPALWGFNTPVLLLPRSALTWPAERLHVVVVHEMAHAMRRDVATMLFARVVRSIFWFHPLAWSLDRAARRECERACDDIVLRAGCTPADYAEHLLSIARAPHRGRPAVGGRGDLARVRIRRTRRGHSAAAPAPQQYRLAHVGSARLSHRLHHRAARGGARGRQTGDAQRHGHADEVEQQ